MAVIPFVMAKKSLIFFLCLIHFQIQNKMSILLRLVAFELEQVLVGPEPNNLFPLNNKVSL